MHPPSEHPTDSLPFDRRGLQSECGDALSGVGQQAPSLCRKLRHSTVTFLPLPLSISPIHPSRLATQFFLSLPPLLTSFEDVVTSFESFRIHQTPASPHQAWSDSNFHIVSFCPRHSYALARDLKMSRSARNCVDVWEERGLPNYVEYFANTFFLFRASPHRRNDRE
jgi:hypothetical protein